VSASSGSTKAKVTKVTECDGDIDVSQRKNKVITLFDVKLVLGFEGEVGDVKDVSGTITIPEVAHDSGADDYVVSTAIYGRCQWKGFG